MKKMIMFIIIFLGILGIIFFVVKNSDIWVGKNIKNKSNNTGISIDMKIKDDTFSKNLDKNTKEQNYNGSGNVSEVLLSGYISQQYLHKLESLFYNIKDKNSFMAFHKIEPSFAFGLYLLKKGRINDFITYQKYELIYHIGKKNILPYKNQLIKIYQKLYDSLPNKLDIVSVYLLNRKKIAELSLKDELHELYYPDPIGVALQNKPIKVLLGECDKIFSKNQTLINECKKYVMFYHSTSSSECKTSIFDSRLSNLCYAMYLKK